jgi:hypothetical protein
MNAKKNILMLSIFISMVVITHDIFSYYRGYRGYRGYYRGYRGGRGLGWEPGFGIGLRYSLGWSPAYPYQYNGYYYTSRAHVERALHKARKAERNAQRAASSARRDKNEAQKYRDKARADRQRAEELNRENRD